MSQTACVEPCNSIHTSTNLHLRGVKHAAAVISLAHHKVAMLLSYEKEKRHTLVSDVALVSWSGWTAAEPSEHLRCADSAGAGQPPACLPGTWLQSASVLACPPAAPDTTASSKLSTNVTTKVCELCAATLFFCHEQNF